MLAKIGRRFAGSAIALACVLTTNLAVAQEKRVLQVGAMTAYPPFQFKDPASDELKGFDIDLFEAMASRMGAKVNWKQMDWLDMVNGVKTKRIDLMINIADLPERRGELSFLDYSRMNSVFFVQKMDADRIPSMDALCGKRVVASRGTAQPALARKWSDEHCTKLGKSAVDVLEVGASADVRMQLTQRRADAATDVETLLRFMDTEQKYTVVGEPYAVGLLGMGFAADNQEFGKALKSALEAVIADGTYKKLLAKWKFPDRTGIGNVTINGQ
ncbi:transporter substrate-binding domain-containing protein [Bradyrhizobium sp. USDA 223]|uniref:transporter substrate-binding domain-containing protein n=1 Tax=Bradyrhizobium sp. USDA 223 TaxID=3156306 RepID=UPI003834137E